MLDQHGINGEVRLKLDRVPADTDCVAASPIRLRYPATCANCGTDLAKGAEALWNREKEATCAPVLKRSPVIRLTRGASARGSGVLATQWLAAQIRFE